MTEDELKSVVAAEIRQSLGYLGGELGAQRENAMRRYLAEPYGNEQDGRSQIVSSDIMDTIEGILPHLMKLFAAGDEIVRFEPQGPEDEEAAAQATEYVNWIFTRDNDGFRILYEWFKDALLQKNGVVKAWWERGETWKRETYRGLTDDAFALLLQDVAAGEVELVSHEMSDAGLHDAVVRRSERTGRVRVCPVPPEEFLISPEARSVADARFVGHRRRRALSDLVAEGYDRAVLDRLPQDDAADLSGEALSRDTVDDTPGRDDVGLNEAMRQVWVTEAYLRVDYDGDGIAELRKVTIAGAGEAHEVLANEEWDFPAPFASVTPIIMPHRFFGLSEADLLDDIQLIKTTVTRQYLDGLYLANNPRHEVVEDNIKDPAEFLTSKPGGYVRVARPGSIQPIMVPFVGNHALQGLEYLDRARENRSGFNRYAQGSDTNAINKTASGVITLQNAAMERVLLIARVFAETGVKDLFRLILKLVSEHQDQARIIRLRNRWVPMNPRDWATEFDASIAVGLGTGNKQQQFALHMQIAQLQAAALRLQGGPNGPLVTWRNLYRNAEKLVEAAGLKSVEPYFSEPGPAMQRPPMAPPPQQSDPRLAALQAKIGLERAKAQADMQLDREKAANDARLAAYQTIVDALLRQREQDLKAALATATAKTGHVA